MLENDRNQFDDPILKSAVRRAWGAERAPDGLRTRVAGMLAESAATEEVSAEDPVPMRLVNRDFGWRLPAWFGYAAAALVILTVSLVGWRFMGDADQLRQGGPVLAGGIPVSFVNDIVHTHDCGHHRRRGPGAN